MADALAAELRRESDSNLMHRYNFMMEGGCTLREFPITRAWALAEELGVRSGVWSATIYRRMRQAWERFHDV